ncbi:Serine/threonine-protein phosphatase 6 regulatory ankyrin repeat subunit A [Cytospora mali]|uniref:Serine/threonine-protein phosphatase 6 regulatory ankyrin repeat subunit A n=1 Tax=Cytospora mali TaxID=578113 RepID=A0A194URF6_CYTMA|nr:Serine/threonine-protein phosphatase 6 regulatory ankyrin repeat subunit A [Valsa mali var. pyri (nom. inval.)]
MAHPSTSTPASRYHRFRIPEHQRYAELGPEDYVIQEATILDHDGSALYDDGWSSLRTEIIKNNDVALLRKYIDKFPGACGPGCLTSDDPFNVAASCGSTDALRMMLEHWVVDPSQTIPAPDEREFHLLNAACLCGQVDTVRFLVDQSQPWAARFGKINENAKTEDSLYDDSSLIAAARSYGTRPRRGQAWRNSEEMMCLLLSMGTSALDTVSWPDEEDTPPAVPQLTETVLSLAITGASADMVRRLIDGGADIHVKVHPPTCHGLFGGTVYEVRDVTVLHIGSFHFNADGIQALFTHRGSEVSVADMVSCRDDHGRIPLHWAAGSDYPEKFDLEACKGDDDNSESITSQAISTIKLLLAGNTDTINARDASGNTPLHYAPLDAALITLLVGCGINVEDVDVRGMTAVHLAANGLLDVEAVRILLKQAGLRANEVLQATDAQGNTPLHIAAATGHVYDAVTTDDRIRAQEEIMRALLPRGRAGEGIGEGDTAGLSLMDQPNAVGKTPRKLYQGLPLTWASCLKISVLPVANRKLSLSASSIRCDHEVLTSAFSQESGHEMFDVASFTVKGRNNGMLGAMI